MASGSSTMRWMSIAWVPAQRRPDDRLQPADRVRLVLPMTSLIPPEVEAELSERFGERFAKLDPARGGGKADRPRPPV
jgi:hypothetical protein